MKTACRNNMMPEMKVVNTKIAFLALRLSANMPQKGEEISTADQ